MNIDIKKWNSGFTDPNDNNSQQYRYLVHGIGNEQRVALQRTFLIKSTQPQEYDSSQLIDLLLDPFRISQKRIISASVVDQDHTATYGEVGFILKAPAENVLKMSPQDNGTFFSNPDNAIKKMRDEPSINSLESLMNQTGNFSAESWNEVCLEGTTESGSVEIIGVFIKTNKRGNPKNPEMAEKIQQVANRYGLPIIKIEGHQLEYSPSKPDIHENGVGLNGDNCRYWLDFRKRKFLYIDEDLKSHEMTQEEAIKTIRTIEKEASSNDLEPIQDKLKHMKELIPNLPLERTVPKIHLDPPQLSSVQKIPIGFDFSKFNI